MVVSVGKRFAWVALLWLLAGFFGALLVWMAPGFGIDERELDPRWTKDSLTVLRTENAQRQNPVSFYFNWLTHVAQGDLGESSSLGRPVTELLRERLPVTLRSTAFGLLLGWVAGLLLVMVTYFLPFPVLDWGTTAGVGILLCLPSGLVAVLFLMLNAPVWCAVATVVLPQVFSYTRNLCASAMKRPHVLMAAAKGVGRVRIFFWHVLGSVGPQMLALAGVSATLAFTACIPIEVICDSPGCRSTRLARGDGTGPAVAGQHHPHRDSRDTGREFCLGLGNRGFRNRGSGPMNWKRTIGLGVVVAVFVLAMLADIVAPHSYKEQFREHVLAPPSADYPLGTDDLGRDRLSRLIHGTRVSLLLAPAAALLTTMIAAAIGLLAGFFGGFWEWAGKAATGPVPVSAVAVSPAHGPGHAAAEHLARSLADHHLRAAGSARMGVRLQAGGLSRPRSQKLGFPVAGQSSRPPLPAPHARTDSAESAASAGGAVLARRSCVFVDGSQSRNTWPGSLRTAAVMGKPAARTRRHRGRGRESTVADARGVAGACPELPALRRPGKGPSVMRILLRVLILAALALTQPATALAGGELTFALPFDPKTLEPNMATDDSSEVVQYLTAGVLIRVNRKTQELQPELAESWKTSADGKSITLHLREGVQFSDGTPFTAADVAYTFLQMMDPKRQSPVADSFRTGEGNVETLAADSHTVTVRFPAPVAGVEHLLDEVAIQSAKSPEGTKAVLGPFVLAEHRAGAFLLLRRNPNYWKKDASGVRLPYLDSIRIEIQSNPELESMRFRRGQFHLMNLIEPNQFDRLARARGVKAVDIGASLDMESSGSTWSRKHRFPATRRSGSPPVSSEGPSPPPSTGTTCAALSTKDTPAREWGRSRPQTASGATRN